MRLCVVLFLLVTGCWASSPPGSERAAAEAKCPFEHGVTYDPAAPYPFCQWETDRGFERYCPPTTDGWGYMNWHTSSDGSASLCDGSSPNCNTCLCSLSCTLGAPIPLGPDGGRPAGPCPAPTTGTAAASCVDVHGSGPLGTCFLFCDAGETCPDGMRCVLDPAEDSPVTGGHHLCAWAIGDDRCSL